MDSRQTVTAEARLRSQASLCGICVDKVAQTSFFVILFPLSLVNIIAPLFHTRSFIHHRRRI